ncbi:type IV pilus twitching motility protein PilT [Phormidium sp. CLA17]|uniref:type IV pilus twitching motility protein PilT n=1 Tax=Leptolyngbya sp. Cla-17 TaxID=2803751 RepID=UPI0014929420|nr:type IV pilus twitching motility protein PilT [Leptolyngbya sp. Cla-17]MBM0741135.1 type IV pilus twitching motility protein PilT [Leptolyngbya sp. Cla-17]
MTEPQRQPSAPPPSRIPPAPPPPRAANNGATVAATQQMNPPTMISPAVAGATMVSSQAPPSHLSGAATAISSSPPQAPPPAGHRPTSSPTAPASTPRRAPTNGSPTLSELVRTAFDKGYSDVHVGVGEVPRYRNRGEMDHTEWPETDRDTFYSWLQEILTDAEIRRFEEMLEFDGATQYDFARVRINIFGSLHGPAMVMRLIPMKILTVEQLNLPPIFKDICHYHKGLILITGPTGSGKSTTMAAMVDYMNKEMPKHIITIEDPIEFVHRSKKALIKHREVGIHTHKFDSALKAALREDPDVILVGEMRDRETVNTALKAAQTGHLVMGTLHTNSAVKTIERILQLFEPDQQEPIRVSIAESMVAVIAQGLCRTTDGKRAAFHDILINTDAIRDYIRKGDLDEVEQLIPRCTFDGMCNMNQSLYKLYETGRITEETALEMSQKPNEMAQMLRGRI